MKRLLGFYLGLVLMALPIGAKLQANVDLSQEAIGEYIYFRCNSTGWGVNDGNRMKLDGSLLVLEFEVSKKKLLKKGDDCIFTATRRLNAWGKSESYFGVDQKELEVPAFSSGEFKLSKENDVYFKLKYSKLGRYKVILSREQAWMTVIELNEEDSAEIPASQRPSLVAQGSTHFLAVGSSGDLYEWGEDIFGDFSSNEPVKLASGPFDSVGMGIRFACALKKDNGKVYCYSRSGTYYGELGRGRYEGRTQDLLPVESNKEFVQLSVGASHACAIDKSGDLYCWGAGSLGQLGNDRLEDSNLPVLVASDRKWIQVSAGGSHTCAVAEDASGWCWGGNFYNQASPEQGFAVSRPSKLPGSWQKISAGSEFNVGLDPDGLVYAWGLSEKVDVDFAVGGITGAPLCYDTVDDRFCSEALGGDYVQVQKTPKLMDAKRHFEDVMASQSPCALKKNTKQLYCWGYATGEAFAGGFPQSSELRKLPHEGKWKNLGVNSWGAARCAIDEQDKLWCWGINEFDCDLWCSLGDGSYQLSDLPVQVKDLKALSK